MTHSQRILGTCLLLFAVLSVAVNAQRPADIERLDAIDHLSPFELSRGRRGTPVMEALAADWSTEQVLDLVRDDDPKVRAIALVLLHEQLGPRALPMIAKLFDDRDAAPPRREFNLAARPITIMANPGASIPKQREEYKDHPQTVGSVALGLVAPYLSTALQERHQQRRGYLGEASIRGAFAEYMQTRHDRANCLVWLRVATQRAAGGIEPTPPERLSKLAAVRQRIDSVPTPDRHWYLLSLANDWSLTGSKHLATEQELVAAARALGPSELLRMLRGFGPADGAKDPGVDPDLTAVRGGVFAWQPIAQFVIGHGAELFPVDRCDEFLQVAAEHVRFRSGGLGVGHYGIDSAGWYLAAADLQPERAAAHIAAGFATIPAELTHHTYRLERGHLAAGAWARLGDAGQRLAIDWFYTEGPYEQFINELASSDRAAWLWALVLDARFEKCGWGTLDAMARACNACVSAPAPFSPEELRRARHPMGRGYEAKEADALARWPAETEDLQRVLSEWRLRLLELARKYGK
tara:strand:+ start:1000 stop:2568 length:1569 start_codon:yes stop_codon:yes gene_type:complete